jgi:hypothetical protein
MLANAVYNLVDQVTWRSECATLKSAASIAYKSSFFYAVDKYLTNSHNINILAPEFGI